MIQGDLMNKSNSILSSAYIPKLLSRGFHNGNTISWQPLPTVYLLILDSSLNCSGYKNCHLFLNKLFVSQ